MRGWSCVGAALWGRRPGKGGGRDLGPATGRPAGSGAAYTARRARRSPCGQRHGRRCSRELRDPATPAAGGRRGCGWRPCPRPTRQEPRPEPRLERPSPRGRSCVGAALWGRRPGKGGGRDLGPATGRSVGSGAAYTARRARRPPCGQRAWPPVFTRTAEPRQAGGRRGRNWRPCPRPTGQEPRSERPSPWGRSCVGGARWGAGRAVTSVARRIDGTDRQRQASPASPGGRLAGRGREPSVLARSAGPHADFPRGCRL